MRIGIFDSGIGGEAVAWSLRNAFPEAEIMTVSDREHLPYSSRARDEIRQLTNLAIQPLLKSKCDVIVIACNTATAAAIDFLRQSYPNQKFIGLEPMVKPAAALSSSGVIAICATPTTLASPRYDQAKKLYATNVKVIEPDCSDWAALIEASEMNRERIDEVANSCNSQKADVVVLGCTHYHWIKEEIVASLGSSVVVLDPADAVIRRIKDLTSL